MCISILIIKTIWRQEGDWHHVLRTNFWANLTRVSELAVHPWDEQIHTLCEIEFQTLKLAAGFLFVVSSNLKLIDDARSGRINASLLSWPVGRDDSSASVSSLLVSVCYLLQFSAHFNYHNICIWGPLSNSLVLGRF
jgi:hypothetical protein